MTARAWLKWAARACEALVAATILLLLVQMHFGIVQTALTMAGARTDVPLVLAINDRCKRELMPPAWAADRKESIFRVSCGNSVNVVTTAPVGKQFSLFVNDEQVAQATSRAPLVMFPEVALRPGPNTLFVVHADSRTVDYPHPTLRSGQMDQDTAHFTGTFWGEMMPLVVAPYAARIMLDPRRLDPTKGGTSTEPPSPPARYGPYDGAPRDFVVRQGLPGTDVDDQTDGSRGSTFGIDGFVVEPADSEAPIPVAEFPIKRELTIRSAGNDVVELVLSACLPPQHPFVQWSRSGKIGAAELITRLTGYYLTQPRPFADAIWQQRAHVQVAEQPNGACVPLASSYRQRGTIYNQWGHTFLWLPGDKLILDAALEATLTPSRPPDGTEKGAMVWRGNYAEWVDQVRFEAKAARSLILRDADGSDRAIEARPSAARQRLLDQWRNLADVLPSMIKGILWYFAVILPVALIYWALGRHGGENPNPRQIDRARAGVLALLIFMTVLALDPVLRDLSRIGIELASLWWLIFDEARIDNYIYGPPVAPIAFMALLMMSSILRSWDPAAAPPTSAWRRAFAFVASLLLLGLALAVANLEQWIVGGFYLSNWQDREVIGGFTAADMNELVNSLVAGIAGSGANGTVALLSALVLLWCAVGLLAFWIPVYWLGRTVVRRGPLLGAAFAAAALAFFVPLLTPAAEALRILIAAETESYSRSAFGAAGLSGLAALTSIASVVIVVTLVLRGFREITVVMLDPAEVQKFRIWSRTSILFIAAVLIVSPTTRALASTDTPDLQIYRFMTIFQAYGGLLALLGPLLALRIVDTSRRGADFATRFRIDDTALLLLAAAFAGYVSLWVKEPLGVPILIAAGWLVFTYVIIGPAPVAPHAAEPGLAQRILAYRADIRLLEARRKTYEKEFGDGKVDAKALTKHRAEIERESAKARARLGMPIAEATRRLLGPGPGASPLRNGLVGASAGLLAAALFQVLLPIDFRPGTTDESPNWLNALQAVIVDPNYLQVGSNADVPGVIAVVSELLNAFAIWVILGFLFGFTFHRIRGGDGFVKAIVFAVGIGITFLIGQALIARGQGVPLGSLARLVPIFVFLIFLGSLVFDRRSLKRQEMPLGQLPAIYGFQTSIGYASFAGAIAGIQPVVQFISGLFK